jgi:YD repeat-containing protein
MPVYDFMRNQVSLRITDIPLGYTPPKGPAVQLRLVYHHRNQSQPQTFSFWNVGYRWMIDWVSYVVDNSTGAPTWGRVYLRGGGSEEFWQASEGHPSAAHWRSRAVLVRTSTDPIRDERRLRDGTVEVFAQSDGATGVGRRVFLTELLDPQGLSLAFTYDEGLRLVAVTDAVGQVTTLAYALGSDPLTVTTVTDPFAQGVKPRSRTRPTGHWRASPMSSASPRRLPMVRVTSWPP